MSWRIELKSTVTHRDEKQFVVFRDPALVDEDQFEDTLADIKISIQNTCFDQVPHAFPVAHGYSGSESTYCKLLYQTSGLSRHHYRETAKFAAKVPA